MPQLFAIVSARRTRATCVIAHARLMCRFIVFGRLDVEPALSVTVQ